LASDGLKNPFYTTAVRILDNNNIKIMEVNTCDLALVLQHHTHQQAGVSAECVQHIMARARLYASGPGITNALCGQKFWVWEQTGVQPSQDTILHAMLTTSNLFHSYVIRRGSNLQTTPHSTYGRESLLLRMRLGLWIVRPRTPEPDSKIHYGKPFCVQYVGYDTSTDKLVIRKLRCLERKGEGIFVVNEKTNNHHEVAFLGHTVYHVLCNLSLRLIDYAYFYSVDERLRSVRVHYG